MTPEEFAKEAKLLLEAGAGIVGGCCGTTPQHIRAFKGFSNNKRVDFISLSLAYIIFTHRRSLNRV